MKFQLITFLFLSVVSFSSAQSITVERTESQAIEDYLVELSFSWTTLGPREIYKNNANTVLVLKSSNQQTLIVNVPSSISILLSQNANSKAIKSFGNWYVVNQYGDII